MQGRDADYRRLARRLGGLIKQLTMMKAEHPLQPVWGGLPRADSEHRVIDEPPQYDDEELEVLALREPLSEFLKAAKRYLTDFGTRRQNERFRENTLVEIAYFGHPGRRGLSERWGLSERTIRRLIDKESGVIRIQKNSRLKRGYRRVQVPASVAERIHRKITRE